MPRSDVGIAAGFPFIQARRHFFAFAVVAIAAVGALEQIVKDRRNRSGIRRQGVMLCNAACR